MITNKQAQEAAQAFIDHYFGNATDRKVRVGIPARPGYDDDLMLSEYLDQCEKLEARFDDVFVAARQAECAIERTLKTGLFLGVLVEQDLRAALDAVRKAQADDESVDAEPRPTPADRSLLAAANRALVDRVRELEAEVLGGEDHSEASPHPRCTRPNCEEAEFPGSHGCMACCRLRAEEKPWDVPTPDDVSPFTLAAAEQRGASRAAAEFNRIHEALVAAYERVWWMAEQYAEGGGSGGPERRDLDEAREEIDKLKKEWQET